MKFEFAKKAIMQSQLHFMCGSNFYETGVTFYFFLALCPMVKTMMQWKTLAAFGDTALASTIRHCFDVQQGSKRDENPSLKLISTKGITGKTKIYNIQAGPSMMWFFYACCRCSMRSFSKFSAWLA